MAVLTTLIADAAAKSAAGDRVGELAAYRDAVKIAPGRAELWHNLGALYAAQGARDDALAALAEAARLRPDWAEPWHARGHVLHAARDFEGARAAFEAALVRDGEHLAARVNLALTLNGLQRYSLALPHLFQARERAPADATIWWILRTSLLRLRRDEDALSDFLRFEPFATVSARATIAALWAARRIGDAEREERALAAALSFPYARGDAPLVADALALVQYHDVERAALFDLYRTYDGLMRAELEGAGDVVPLAPATPRRFPDHDRRIRVGYLSADFRQHVMGEILAPVLALHDHGHFDIRLYSIAPAAN